jgi:hypothetical protein
VNKQILGVWKMVTKQQQTKVALEGMWQFAYWKNI